MYEKLYNKNVITYLWKNKKTLIIYWNKLIKKIAQA